MYRAKSYTNCRTNALVAYKKGRLVNYYSTCDDGGTRGWVRVELCEEENFVRPDDGALVNF